MSVIKSNGAGSGASGGFYNGVATTSFRNIPGTTLTRDYGSSPTNAKIMSFGGWIKRQQTGFYSNLLSSTLGGGGVAQGYIFVNESDVIAVQDLTAGGATTFSYITNRVFRDLSSWYHLWVRIDTTDSTEADRVQLWINGVRETSFSTSTAPSLNATPVALNGNKTHFFGHSSTSHGGNVYYCDWYWLDGSSVSPVDTVGEFKEGIFIPKSYSSASFGNKGWHLKFDQTGVGSPSSSTIGADSSGNSNHWTSTANTNAVASDCALPDSPENNFCIMNFATKNTYNWAYGNLSISRSASTGQSATLGTFSVSSGKWYWEVRLVSGQSNYPRIGIFNTNLANNHIETNYPAANDLGARVWGSGADGSTNKIFGDSNTEAAFGSYDDGDIVQFALDMDNFKMYMGKNDTWYTNSSTTTSKANISDSSANAAFDSASNLDINSGDSFAPCIFANAAAEIWILNFGQDSSFIGGVTAQGNTDANGVGDFYYEPPSSFLALCSANLPEPTISPNKDTQANDHFTPYIWTGNGSNPRAFTDVGFQADWIWIKRRTGSTGTKHHLQGNSTIGDNKTMLPNEPNPESAPDANGTISDTTTAGGFTVNAGATSDYMVNTNSSTYVAWLWKANGGTTSSNSEGTTTSTVQANTTAGFSIVNYDGNSSSRTVGHGLDSAPEWVIVKTRATERWTIFHTSISNGYIYLNENFATQTGNADERFGNSSSVVVPNSTVVTLGANNSDVNQSGENYIMYCFHEVKGYSKFGTYAGNGDADGAFVYTGFRPAYFLHKRVNSSEDWHIIDSVRNPNNKTQNIIFANLDDLETVYTSEQYDILSNGIKLRNTGSSKNGSGDTYIYMAFAEAPFKYALAR